MSYHLTPFDRLRLERGVAHLDRLGMRAKVEFWADLGSRIGGMPAMLGLLAEYERRLTPAMTRAAGSDRPLRRLVLVPRA